MISLKNVLLYSCGIIAFVTPNQYLFADSPLNNLKKGTNILAVETKTMHDSIGPSDVYINTNFENGSQLNWQVNSDGEVVINLMYDHERFSPNKSVSHWNFQILTKSGSDVTVILKNLVNVYNGRHSAISSDRSICYISSDGDKWTVIPTEVTKDNSLKFTVNMNMKGTSMYISEMEPYRVSDLKDLFSEIENNSLVNITPIGKTVEGRQLEIIRIGNPEAPHGVFFRGRAHGYEAGGNWVLQGLIRKLLEDNKDIERYLKRYCVYILPMANKDAVVQGKARFNSLGMDLNRNWNEPADPDLTPENSALENWLRAMVIKDMKLDLVIDFHNDAYGGLHKLWKPDTKYHSNMKKFESLLHRYTWYNKGSTGPEFKDNAGTIPEGLLTRYGIEGLVFELNYLWASGLNKVPKGKDWELLGSQLPQVLFQYFDHRK